MVFKLVERALLAGGDTDTNACIICGLIGAAVGYSNIPPEIAKFMLECDTTNGMNPRPDFLSPKDCDLLKLVETIYNRRPADLKIINNDN